jgi:solute carrier family 13 (sodium-dependent dicarboxylate transporter), member 2/3/5
MVSISTAPADLNPAPGSFLKRFGLLIAFAALFLIVSLPQPTGLSVVGQRMLGLLVFSIIVWMTESVTYPVSAALIMSMMTLLWGFSSDPAKPGAILGTAAGLTAALDGFKNTALALVAAAVFLSAAMMQTGLDKRLALFILSKIGGKTSRILAGLIICCAVLSFFVPSTTARVACLVPIVLGVIRIFGVERRSRLAGLLMIATAQGDTIWNIGLKTGAAQNLVAAGFMEKMLGVSPTWPQWMMAGFPFSVVMSFVLYFILLRVLPPEVTEIPGGQEKIRKELESLGPWTSAELRLLAISFALLGLWATERILHPIDSASATVIAISVMLLPKIGVMTWRQAQPKIPWDTVVLFGVGISLGSAILNTRAAGWLADLLVGNFGLANLAPIALIAALAAFLVIIHLGFASATALASAMIPIVIAVVARNRTPGLNQMGTALIIHFTVCFGFVLPVNAPQNMVAFGTDTFEARDFMKAGIPLTLIAYAMILIFAMTYWRWIGLVVAGV